MYPPGHIGLTAVLFAPLICWLRRHGRGRTATECLAVATALSLLPDIDALLPGIVHRGVTHTLLAAIVAGGIVLLLVRYSNTPALSLGSEHATVPWVVGTTGVLSHLLGDVVTPMGIGLLYPIYGTVYTLDIVPASSPAANATLFVAGLTAVGLAYQVPVGVSNRSLDEGMAEESSLSVSSRR